MENIFTIADCTSAASASAAVAGSDDPIIMRMCGLQRLMSKGEHKVMLSR